MEGKKQSSSTSSSSLTTELFGSNDTRNSSSSGIFDSIFSPSSKVIGRDSMRSAVNGKTVNEGSNSKIGTQDKIYNGSDGDTQSTANKDMSSIYQEQRVQPCHLSSSIYYGGQDIYFHPSTKDSGLNSMYKKDGGEDDSGSASRGNWWQGSLYY